MSWRDTLSITNRLLHEGTLARMKADPYSLSREEMGAFLEAAREADDLREVLKEVVADVGDVMLACPLGEAEIILDKIIDKMYEALEQHR